MMMTAMAISPMMRNVLSVATILPTVVMASDMARANWPSRRRVTDGASRASPAAITRMASAQLGGLDVFEQEPAGSGRDRRVHVLIQVIGGQHEDAGGAAGGHDLAGGLDPVQVRHPDVHQDHVRLGLPGQADRLPAVLGLADDLQVRPGFQDHPEPAADQGLVIAQQHPDGHDGPALPRASTGKATLTAKPPPGRGPAWHVPPCSAARSPMPISPRPRPGPRWPARAAARPSSVTSTTSPAGP